MWIPYYLQIFDISFREVSFLHFTQVWTVNCVESSQTVYSGEDEAQHDRRKEARKISNANVNLPGKNKAVS